MVNHNKVNHFQQLISFLVINYDIKNKQGYVVSPAELRTKAIEVYPRINEYVTIYNQCVDLIGRLRPTINTTFHILLNKEFGLPLHLLRTSQLYKVKDMLLQRL
jgi:hypothetical protein